MLKRSFLLFSQSSYLLKSYRKILDITIRSFGKSRIVINDSISATSASSKNVITLNPFNRIKDVSQQSYLPLTHVRRAICRKEGKYFYLKDEEGVEHLFSDERDVIVPYGIAKSYLNRCKKECSLVEIDPENTTHEINSIAHTMIKRKPVISVVGEMDHGKTTLLDLFQHTTNQKQEFGGTTQIIRASSIELPILDSNGNSSLYPCTFLDTPDQFNDQIRENGSILSDLCLYVVSMSEGPSAEADIILSQLKENKIDVFLVMTKSDIVTEDRKNFILSIMLDKAKQHSVSIIDYVMISSITGDGIIDLQHRITSVVSSLQQSVPADIPAEASILDSVMIPSQGIVFRALIQQGVLSLRDNFICGMYTGRVKSIVDLDSRSIQTAFPGMVVNILGARKLPAVLRKNVQLLPSGNTLFVRSIPEIETIWNQRMLEYTFRASKCESTSEPEISEDVSNENNESNGNIEIIDGEEYAEVKSQPVIVIADNANSVNIILENLATKPGINVVRTRVGQITEKDITECKESTMKIVSFNVELPPKVKIGKKKFIFNKIMSDLIVDVNNSFSGDSI